MRKLFTLLAVLALTACTTVQNWIPSFWDDNQSNYIVQAQVTVQRISCDQPQLPQLSQLSRELELFQAYSHAKGSLQKDVIRVVEPMKSTVDEWIKRGEGSKTYCELKKKILTQQGERASKVILGRW